MHTSVHRIMGATALLFGIAVMAQTTSGAADAVSEGELKTIVEQDAKNIAAWAEIGKKAVAAREGRSKLAAPTRSVTSSAMSIALAAQSRMTGKNAAQDAKLAALRDAALDIAKSAGAKKFANALAVAKTLSLNMPAGKGNVKTLAVADLAKTTSFEMADLMHVFRTATAGGYGIEKEVQDNAKNKSTMLPDKAALLARRALLVADFSDVLEIDGGFAGPAMKKAWLGRNQVMKAAAADLLAAANAKNAKDIQAAFVKLDASCVACHNQFKK